MSLTLIVVLVAWVLVPLPFAVLVGRMLAGPPEPPRVPAAGPVAAADDDLPRVKVG